MAAPPLKDIKSPMVGTFYKAPEPGAEPYAKVGTRVSPGQTVCIIEAMKVMNEIKAETGAKGKELFHPVRIALTGAYSGPEFDKLIPIFEEGTRLPIPIPVPSVRERVEQFAA